MTFPFPMFAPTVSGALSTAFSAVSVRKSSNQTGADYTAGVAVTWDTEDYDVGGWHSGSSSQLVTPSGVGYVQLAGGIYATNVTANKRRTIEILKNGASLTPLCIAMEADSGTVGGITIDTWPIAVTAGDYFELKLTMDNDASIDITAAYSWLSAWAVG